jgi:C_GCAxxG_C_C family probable redox protein
MNKNIVRHYALKLLETDYHCGEVVVRTILNELEIKAPASVLRISASMNGGGRAGAQCGILEAGLFVLSLLYGRHSEKQSREPLQSLAFQLTKKFETEYKNLLCRDIRPEGFSTTQPRGLCTERIICGIFFLLDFFEEIVEKYPPKYSYE